MTGPVRRTKVMNHDGSVALVRRFRAAAERFVARYNDTGSLRPSDYSGITRNASYIGLLLEA